MIESGGLKKSLFFDISVTEENVSNFLCQKRLFLEYRPLEFGLKYEKYEIEEDIHTNCVIHFEK